MQATSRGSLGPAVNRDSPSSERMWVAINVAAHSHRQMVSSGRQYSSASMMVITCFVRRASMMSYGRKWLRHKGEGGVSWGCLTPLLHRRCYGPAVGL